MQAVPALPRTVTHMRTGRLGMTDGGDGDTGPAPRAAHSPRSQAGTCTTMSRLQETLRTVPQCTLFVLGTCVGLHVATFLFGIPVDVMAISAAKVLKDFELYVMVTSVLFHTSLMHLAFNMLSTFALAASLVRCALPCMELVGDAAAAASLCRSTCLARWGSCC